MAWNFNSVAINFSQCVNTVLTYLRTAMAKNFFCAHTICYQWGSHSLWGWRVPHYPSWCQIASAAGDVILSRKSLLKLVGSVFPLVSFLGSSLRIEYLLLIFATDCEVLTGLAMIMLITITWMLEFHTTIEKSKSSCSSITSDSVYAAVLNEALYAR